MLKWILHITFGPQTLNEYIKDTEDMVSIKLDTHRNALITVDLVLTAFSACLAIVTAISGIFGMNLESGLETVGVSSGRIAHVSRTY